MPAKKTMDQYAKGWKSPEQKRQAAREEADQMPPVKGKLPKGKC